MINIGNIVKITGAQLALVLADNTQLTIGSERISMNGIVLDNSTSLDGQFTIGAAVTGQMSVTLFNADEAYTQYNFRDATAQLTFTGPTSIPDDDDDVVTIDSVIVGQYNIADYTYDGSNIVLTAYDNLCKLDVPCTETNGTTVSFPITTKGLVTAACTICGVTLADSVDPIPNGTYSVAQKPDQWDTMTWHDIISYCAQIGGVYAKTDKYGRLFFDWYDITTQQTDPDAQVIPSPYALSTDTDDVYITGLKVVLEASDNINADENTQQYTTALYGTDGYVITISGNPLIQTTTQADSIKDYLGAVAVGMYFRPLTATIVEDPTVETGDQVFITGRNSAVYQCIVSHVTYTTNAATVITCDAEPVKSNLKTRFTAADKLASHVEKVQRKLEDTYKIAGNTNQYFWHTETGTDTGAHITEVPKDEWEDSGGQYYHSGGNLLARSNGLAVRDGMTELASFSSNGAVVGQTSASHSVIDADGQRFYASDGHTLLANIGYRSGAAESGTATAPYYSFGKRDDSYVGNYSFASGSSVGYNNQQYSLAAVNFCSHAEGGGTRSVGFCAHAEGFISRATGDSAHAEGFDTVAGPYSHSEGYKTSAEGSSSHAEGSGSTTDSTVASANAEGFQTQANGNYSHSEGQNTVASGSASHAGGDHTIAGYANQTVIGKYNKNLNTTLFEIGNGNSSTRSNAFYVTTGGAIWVASKENSQENLGILCDDVVGETVTAGSYKDYSVSFWMTYQYAPIVVACFKSTSTAGAFGKCSLSVHSITTTGFKIRVFNGDSSNRSPDITWIAIGK